MRTTSLWLLAVTFAVGGMIVGLPSAAARGAKTATPNAAATKPREIGGPLPLPVVQRIEKENKPSDKLLVEITGSVAEGTHYVAYVKVVWGDLDNVIKKDGPQNYSDWDGSLTLVGGATGAVNKKIQFDDGKGKATTKPKGQPGPGSGRDELLDKSGAKIDWKAGVVGALDGLEIKITSPTAAISGTLLAGKFSIPINIGGPAAVTGPQLFHATDPVPAPAVKGR